MEQRQKEDTRGQNGENPQAGYGRGLLQGTEEPTGNKSFELGSWLKGNRAKGPHYIYGELQSIRPFSVSETDAGLLTSLN